MKTLILYILGLLTLSGCSDRPDYVAETKIEDMTVRVSLRHSHPYLAEYKRNLEIVRAGKNEDKEIFPDTGGYAWVSLFSVRGTLEIKDAGGVQYSTRLAANLGRAKYLGRFDFDAKKAYRFIPASEDPREPEMPK